MVSAMQWFLFGMFVWGCCVVMSVIARRWAPEMWDHHADEDGSRRSRKGRKHWRKAHSEGGGAEKEDPRDVEIRELKKRVETLEAIVTDRKFQWEQELNR